MTKSAVRQARSQLGWGYSIPIVGTALAIVFGLAVFDITRTNLEAWIWVIIQVIIGTSFVLGMRLSARASMVSDENGKRLSGATGAVNLNLILGILFSVVTFSQAFGFGSSPEYSPPF